MNPAQLNSEVANAQKSGAALQSQDNSLVNSQTKQYTANQNQANSAYSNLSNYNKTLQNPAQMYQQYLTGAESAQGFNPQSLSNATQGLTNQEDALGAMTTASQSALGGAGLSGNQMAGLYSTGTQPLTQSVNAQNNAVQNYQQLYQNASNQANQQATLGLQGQQLQSQNYQALYSTAVQQMQASGSTLASLKQVQQQQGYLTAEQTAAYQNAYSSYVSAQAAQTQAAAEMQQASAATTQANAQAAYLGSETTGQNLTNKQTQAAMNTAKQYTLANGVSTTIPSGATPIMNSKGQLLGYENPTTHQDVQL